MSDSGALGRLVKSIEADRYLADSDRFRERAEVLDLLDAFDLNAHSSGDDCGAEQIALRRRARELQAELEDANFRLYESVRDSIRSGAGRNALLRYGAEDPDQPKRETDASGNGDSYDYLDELVSGIFRFAVLDGPRIDLSAEMVAYQPTPARHIFEMLRRVRLTGEDCFIDLGCGLGHVPLLIAICSKARAVGIEIEPSYVECATQCARDLNLAHATFLTMDARNADLSSGTLFYLYTPFRGAILRTVLDRLRSEAETRVIRVCTFGPCTTEVAAESWLRLDRTESGCVSVFRSSG